MIRNRRNKFLKPRKETARILSEIWGMNITVDINEEVLPVDIEIEPDKEVNADDNE